MEKVDWGQRLRNLRIRRGEDPDTGKVLKLASYLKLEKKPLHTQGLPKSELREGVEEEHEHTRNNRIAKQIAVDHLKEDKQYYTHLSQMEQKTAEAFEYGFLKAAMDSGLDLQQSYQLLKQAVEIDEDVPMYKRPVSSTVGRVTSPLTALMLGNLAPVKPGPKQEDLEYMKKYYDKGLDKEDIPLAVYPNRTRPLKNLKRIWQRKKTSIPTKLLGSIASPLGDAAASLQRGDHYNPFAHSIANYTNTPGVQLHELGHAKDFESGKYPGFYTLARSLFPVALYQEYIASHKGMKDMNKHMKSFPKDRQQKELKKARRTMGGGFGSYVGGFIRPDMAIPGALAGQAIGHFNKNMFNSEPE